MAAAQGLCNSWGSIDGHQIGKVIQAIPDAGYAVPRDGRAPASPVSPVSDGSSREDYSSGSLVALRINRTFEGAPISGVH